MKESSSENNGLSAISCENNIAPISGQTNMVISLTDVIEQESLQRIQDAFAYATGVASVIVDMQGELITRPSNFDMVNPPIKSSECCNECGNSSQKGCNCNSSESNVQNYHSYTSSGFIDGSAPILIGDTQVAKWLIGQCGARDRDSEQLADRAENPDIDNAEMIEAFEDTPECNGEKYQLVLNLLNAIAGELSRLGLKNCQLKKEIAAKEEMTVKLAQSEHRLHEIFDSVVEGICIIGDDNIIKIANSSLVKMFGAESPDMIIGKNVRSFFEPDQMKILDEQKALRQNGISSKYEIKLKTLKGTVLDLLVSGNPRFDDTGKYTDVFASIIDISEQKRLQEAVYRAQRLESAGKIAAQVAHDFNNLLGPLMAYPELLKRYVGEDSPAIKLLDDMDKAASVMSDINQQLLTLGRRGYYNQEILNLNELIGHSLNGIASLLEGTSIKLELSNSLMNIKGGGSQLVRVISNIITNSLDAMISGGSLSIKTENYYIDKSAKKYGNLPVGEYVKATFSDNGCGISPENLPFIFDPFFTTKKTDQKRGSGLGLSVVYTVVQDHNGYVSLKSAPERGTSVYLYFPIVRDELSVMEKETITGGDESVLVVDDDSFQRSVMENILKNLGYRVKVFSSGEKAVDYLVNNPCDLILLDIMMPNGIDGVETYAEILKFKPSQKAIIISGYADPVRVKKAKKLGIDIFMKKPLAVRQLNRAIREALDSTAVPELE